jgi:hypothetical protein
VVLCAGFACLDGHWRFLVPALRRRRQMAEAMPDAELHALGEASHSLPIEEPDAQEALVLGWLAERFPPRAGRGPAAQSGATG